MRSIGLVHLVRAANPIVAFEEFLASYKRHPAECDHELLIVYKGFASASAIAPYRKLLAGTAHRQMLVDDAGFDIDAYFAAARRFEHDYLCFLNSYSVILDTGWLGKLMQALDAPGVGLVGATGSWQSSYTHFLEHYYPEGGRPLYKKPVDLARTLYYRLHYPPFPNPHIRTNGFLIPRVTMCGLHRGKLSSKFRTKLEVYRFESGRKSLTQRILRRGETVRIVGKDGVAYGIDAWASSGIFWHGAQENLLIADNQTRAYDMADPLKRQGLAWTSWHESAGCLPSGETSPRQNESAGRNCTIGS